MLNAKKAWLGCYWPLPKCMVSTGYQHFGNPAQKFKISHFAILSNDAAQKSLSNNTAQNQKLKSKDQLGQNFSKHGCKKSLQPNHNKIESNLCFKLTGQ